MFLFKVSKIVREIYIMEKAIDNFIHFIEQSPTAFHAVDSVKVILEKSGFIQLHEEMKQDIEQSDSSKSFFSIRND